MGQAGEWKEAGLHLKGDVRKQGGFLTMQKEEFRKRVDIGRLKANNSESLRVILEEHGMIVIPHPHHARTCLRVYDVESEIGKIAKAILDPEGVETALIDAVNLHARAKAGKERRSEQVLWL